MCTSYIGIWMGTKKYPALNLYCAGESDREVGTWRYEYLTYGVPGPSIFFPCRINLMIVNSNIYAAYHNSCVNSQQPGFRLTHKSAKIILTHSVCMTVSIKAASFGLATRWWRHQMDIFRVTGPLCGEFIGDRWIPLTKASDAGLWYFLGSAPGQTVEYIIDTPVIWDAMPLILTSL